MMLSLIVIASILLLFLLKEIRHLSRALPAVTTRTITVGDTPRLDGNIPPIIWTYWHQATLPEFIATCINTWKKNAPGYEVRILNPANLLFWLGPTPLPALFDQLPHYRQADWIRVQLLRMHGGIWLDASIILTEDLVWLQRLQQHHNVEYVGFYIDHLSTQPDWPIVENWAMAAVPGSRFIADLTTEFDRAIHLGEDDYLAELATQGKLNTVAQGLDPGNQRYLIMHVAISVMLERARPHYSLVLLNAEDSAFAFLAKAKWSKKRMFIRLALMPMPQRLPMLIKFRGADRRSIMAGLARGWVRPGSFMAHYFAGK